MLKVEIYKAFPGFTLDVAFEAENTALALLGASGCGKSMTLKAIAGIVKPDRGRIELDGRVLFDSEKKVNLPPRKRGAGLLFQNYALFPNMTVRENILCGLGGRRPGGRLTELLETFRLTGQAGLFPAQLSGGQQQRTALARMLAASPSLIMLDEPLSALDSYLRWQLEDELASVIAGFPGTVLYVSHNRGEVYRLCREVCVLNNGASDPVVTVRELFERPRNQAAALLSGCKNFSRARPAGGSRVQALDWGLDLDCGPVPPALRDIGVRAHYISPSVQTNRRKYRIVRKTQDIFSVILTLAPLAKEDAAIRMETSLEEAAGLHEGDTVEAGIRPEDILLLE